jgi:hypothetical protein
MKNDDVPTGCGHGLRTGMADAVLREIAALLVRFAATGEPGAIDIKSLPLTPADLAELASRSGGSGAAIEHLRRQRYLGNVLCRRLAGPRL